MKKKIIVILVILLIILSTLGIIFIPKMKKEEENNLLEKEVLLTNNYLSNKVSKKKLNDFIKEDILSDNQKELENCLDNYVQSIIKNDTLIEIINNKIVLSSLNKETIKKLDYNEELKKVFNDYKEKLTNSIENIDNIKINCSKENQDNYADLFKKIDLVSHKKRINNLIKDIDNILASYELLMKKDNYSLEKEIIFNKRDSFKEYDEIQKRIINDYKLDIISYRLIEDKTPPVIEASDLTLLKGNNNLGFKCIDLVDGEVECKISGDYDVNKVGTYNLKVEAKDEEGNTTSKDVQLVIKEQVVYKNPYYIEIVRNHNVVIVYGLDGNNEYTRIVKTFICSVGLNGWTPIGTFTTSKGYEWGNLNGGLYGQYSTRIKGSILFHSVPYYSMSKDQLEWEEFNKLGDPASQGCIRMTVNDVKWIYDNCSNGITVKIYDGELPKGVVKPKAPKIDGESINRGWDPTDPDPNNPWKKD